MSHDQPHRMRLAWGLGLGVILLTLAEGDQVSMILILLSFFGSFSASDIPMLQVT